jgi:chemotaxis protein CheX
MTKSFSNELNYLASEVWSSMANTFLKNTAEAVNRDELNGHVVSSVQVGGAWEGAVRLDMDIAMARATTARLLGAEEADVSAEDIHDAIGEMANMLGGGVKELMPQPCKLSLPSVAIGNERTSLIEAGRVTSECSFVADSGRLHVTVVEKDGEPPAVSSLRDPPQSVQSML